MSFFNKCFGCKKIRIHTKQRTYKTIKMGKVTSDEVCYWCYKKLKNLTKNI